MIFVRCENQGCKRLALWFRVKKQTIYIPKLQKHMTGRIKICPRCRKKVEGVVESMNQP